MGSLAMKDDAMSGLQEMVRDGFIRYGRENYSFEQRRTALGSPLGFSESAWRDYCDMGWLAVRLPEEFGGLDADAEMIGHLMEVVGRHLLLEPVFANAVVGAGAIIAAGPDILKEMGPNLTAGTLKLALALSGEVQVTGGRISGEKVGVLHGDVADQFIVSSGGEAPALYLVDGASTGVSRRAYRLVDGRGAAVLCFDDSPARKIGDCAVLERVLDEANVALCAEALGCTEHLVEATAAYLKVRKQFGRAIGSYQALQHRMSEMLLLLEEIKAWTSAAQRVLSQEEPLRSRVVSGAAAYTIGAARSIGNAAVQLHGGMGVTEELDISHHFRRLMVITALLGGRDVHIERFGRSSFGAAGNGVHP